MEKDWVIAYTTNKLYRAELFKRNLGDNDIESVIINKMDSTYRFGDIEIYVKRDNILRAKKLATEFDSFE
jgi:hypothetical protein